MTAKEKINACLGVESNYVWAFNEYVTFKMYDIIT